MSNRNYSYELSLNILRALGGDMTVQYENTDQIWAAIDGIYAVSGDGLDLQSLVLNITENGTYDYNITDEVDAYVPVNISVNVPQKYTDEQVEDLKDTAREEGYTSGYDNGIADGYVQGESEGYTDGYAEGLEDGAEDQKALLEEITIRDNGVYEKEDGYKKVTVDVSIPEIPTFETEELSVELTTNGTYNYTPTTDGYSKVSVTVDVAGSGGGDTSKPKIYNGFTFNGGAIEDFRTIDFSQYDWSGVYDTSNFFQGFYSTSNSYWKDSDFENFDANFNGKFMSCQHLFKKASGRNAVLNRVPSFLNNRMQDCRDMSYMFNEQIELSNTDNIQYWNTSNVIKTDYMFYYCTKLTTVNIFDTSKVTNMDDMFMYCSKLTTLPLFDTSSVTSMNSMLNGCSALTTIPQFDTSNVTTMNYMLNNCTSLTSVPLLDCSSINSGSGADIFYSAYLNNLTDLGGFKDLGKVSGFTKPSYFLKNCANLTKESVMNVINNLYDRASAGYSVITLPFNTNALALLSDDEKAIATAKGWTLATS